MTNWWRQAVQRQRLDGRALAQLPEAYRTAYAAHQARASGETHTHPLRDPAVPKQAVPRSKAAPAKAKPKAAPKPRPPVAPSKPPPKPKPAVKASPAKLKPAPAVVPTSSSKKPAKAKAKPQAPARSTAKSPGSAAILATKNRNLSDDELEDFSDDEDGGFGDANLTKSECAKWGGGREGGGVR
jgi:outer membrane biosynthesis protein TonB